MDSEAQSSRGLSEIGSPIRVGVAGWSYPEWEGIVYPQTPRTDGLVYLARYLDTIEINSPFYRIPSPTTTASWARRAAAKAGFRFTLKLFRGFTHERSSGSRDEQAFKQALVPLMDGELLGGLLLQFPWSFKNDPENRDYLSKLLDRFVGYPLVVEIRHASWNDRAFFDFLTEKSIAFCNIDQPQIGRSIAPSNRTTGPIGYVRLHGRNYQDWFREDAGRDARYDYLYSEEELDPWMEKISEVSENASETYVITNNHFRGQAVVNALQIRARIEKRKVLAPASLVERYPVLRSVAKPDDPAQGTLF